ncbi:MAG: hypothetical protein JWO06_2697, partial [Bacteroidota bacterium]|nr:hypothetical protein [Bacteroidota bacterium]
KFLTTAGVAAQIEEIIKNAKEHIVLITPYLDVHTLWIQRLQDVSARKIPISLIYRKENNLKEWQQDKLNGELDKLKAVETLSIYEIENLHAKCFMNEKAAIITSMNLWAYSEKNNREMGIVITKLGDREMYNEALQEFESIKYSSLPVRVLSKKVEAAKPKSKTGFKPSARYQLPQSGSCIRCTTSIAFNLAHPLCTKCYHEWRKYNNPNPREEYCLMCSKPDQTTTLNTPLCYECWQEYKFVLPMPWGAHR